MTPSSSKHLPSAERPPWAAALVRVLALALVLASTLGLAHRVLHLSAVAHGQVADAIYATHSAGSEECRLYDQLLHWDGGLPMVWAPPAAPLEPAQPRAIAGHRACPSDCVYLARAPPLAGADLS